MRAVLRAGLAQALYMNVPLPAAVNESVKLTRALGKSSAAGMVNAVLPAPLPPMSPEADFADPSGPALDLLLPVPPGGRAFYAQFGAEAFPWPPHFMKKA